MTPAFNTLRQSANRVGLLGARRCALLVIAALSLLVIPSVASAAEPTAVFMKYAILIPGPQISLDWYNSKDASGHAITYDVYRHTLPITAANIGSLTPFLSTPRSYATVPATSAETTQSFVWWYAVRARETTGTRVSAVANNYFAYAPNPHAMYPWGKSFICYNCHQIHAKASPGGLCYVCHGRADGDATASYGDRSSMHVQSSFYDYASQSAGSKHRNSYMLTLDPKTGYDKTCSACHRAHLSPYRYISATEVSLTASHSRLLAVQTDASGNLTAYARVSGSRKNQFCFACHGSDGAGPMSYVGGPAAFGASGGDHNQSEFDTSTAHGSAVVKSNDEPLTVPAIQCLACHNQHASPTDSLIDYRGSDTTDATRYSEAGLCFTCHAASSAENKVSTGYSAPYSWNARDVQAEFGRASHHPFSTTSTAQGALRCTNCHNTHYVRRTTDGSVDPSVKGSAWDMARVSDPDNTKLNISDKTSFCLSCHDGATPVAAQTTASVVPFTPVFASVAASYFPGWNKSAVGLEFTSSGHYNTPGDEALCWNCHDPHGSDFTRLTAWTAPPGSPSIGTWTASVGTRANTQTAVSREESLCYQCHGNGSSVGALADGAKDVAAKTTAAYAHDPSDVAGLHSDEETAGGLAYSAVGSRRHSECVDCHDPHAARTQGGGALHASGESTAGAALLGAWGVNPNYGTHADADNWASVPQSAFTPLRMNGSGDSFEAYVCMKCHSTNTTLNTAAYTSQAIEFNPSNFSEHNVLGQSAGMENAFTVGSVTYAWTFPPASAFLVSGWTTDSKMTCTDCHDGKAAGDAANVASGPHGSSVQWILDPDYVNWTDTTALVTSGNGMSPSNIICAKCHTNLNTANTIHAKHAGGGAGKGLCRECHIRVPHGWKRPRMLGYTDDPAPYATISGGLLRVLLEDRAYNATAAGSTCKAGCNHTKTAITSYW